MKYEEALENLKYLISDDCTDTQFDYIEEIETAINALEKQIPKEPYWRVEEDAKGWACPVCNMGVTVGRGRMRFCSDCGQKLDWSNEK